MSSDWMLLLLKSTHVRLLFRVVFMHLGSVRKPRPMSFRHRSRCVKEGVVFGSASALMRYLREGGG
jgi:hypothetical protein